MTDLKNRPKGSKSLRLKGSITVIRGEKKNGKKFAGDKIRTREVRKPRKIAPNWAICPQWYYEQVFSDLCNNGQKICQGRGSNSGGAACMRLRYQLYGKYGEIITFS